MKKETIGRVKNGVKQGEKCFYRGKEVYVITSSCNDNNKKIEDTLKIFSQEKSQ